MIQTYWAILSSMENWIVLNYTELYWTVLNYIEQYWLYGTVLNYIELCWTILNSIEQYWTDLTVLNFGELNWTLLNYIELVLFGWNYWTVLNCFELYYFIDLYWTILKCIELYWTVLNYIEMYYFLSPKAVGLNYKWNKVSSRKSQQIGIPKLAYLFLLFKFHLARQSLCLFQLLKNNNKSTTSYLEKNTLL